jgi:hypothetical protein
MLEIGLMVGFSWFPSGKGSFPNWKLLVSHPMLSGGRRLANVKTEKEECPE